MTNISNKELKKHNPYMEYLQGSTLEHHEHRDETMFSGYFYASALDTQPEDCTTAAALQDKRSIRLGLKELKEFCHMYETGRAAPAVTVKFNRLREDTSAPIESDKVMTADMKKLSADNLRRYNAAEAAQAKYIEATKHPLICLDRYGLLNRERALNLDQPHIVEAGENTSYESNFMRATFLEELGIKALCRSLGLTPPDSVAEEDADNWILRHTIPEVMDKITEQTETGITLKTPESTDNKAIFYAAITILRIAAEHFNSIQAAKLLGDIFLCRFNFADDIYCTKAEEINGRPLKRLDNADKKKKKNSDTFTDEQLQEQTDTLLADQEKSQVEKYMSYYAMEVTNNNYARQVISDTDTLLAYFNDGGNEKLVQQVAKQKQYIAELEQWLETQGDPNNLPNRDFKTYKEQQQLLNDANLRLEATEQKLNKMIRLIDKTRKAIGSTPPETLKNSAEELILLTDQQRQGEAVDSKRISELERTIAKLTGEDTKDLASNLLNGDPDDDKSWLREAGDNNIANGLENFKLELNQFRSGFIQYLRNHARHKGSSGKSIFTVVQQEKTVESGMFKKSSSTQPFSIEDRDKDLYEYLTKEKTNLLRTPCSRSLENIQLWNTAKDKNSTLQLVASLEKYLRISENDLTEKSLQQISDIFARKKSEHAVPVLGSDSLEARPEAKQHSELRHLQIETINTRLLKLLQLTASRKQQPLTDDMFTQANASILELSTNANNAKTAFEIATKSVKDFTTQYPDPSVRKKQTGYDTYKATKESVANLENTFQTAKTVLELAEYKREIIDLLNWKFNIQINVIISDFKYFGGLVDAYWLKLTQSDLQLSIELLNDFSARYQSGNLLHINSTLRSVIEIYQKQLSGRPQLNNKEMLDMLNDAMFTISGQSHTVDDIYDSTKELELKPLQLAVTPYILLKSQGGKYRPNLIRQMQKLCFSLFDENRLTNIELKLANNQKELEHAQQLNKSKVVEDLTQERDELIEAQERKRTFYLSSGLSETSPKDILVLLLVLLNQQMYPNKATFSYKSQCDAFEQIMRTIRLNPQNFADFAHEIHWIAATSLDPQSLRYIADNLTEYKLPITYTELVAENRTFGERTPQDLAKLFQDLAQALESMGRKDASIPQVLLSILTEEQLVTYKNSQQLSGKLVEARQKAATAAQRLYVALFQISHYKDHTQAENFTQTGFTLGKQDLPRFLEMCQFNFPGLEDKFAQLARSAETNWNNVRSIFGMAAQLKFNTSKAGEKPKGPSFEEFKAMKIQEDEAGKQNDLTASNQTTGTHENPPALFPAPPSRKRQQSTSVVAAINNDGEEFEEKIKLDQKEPTPLSTMHFESAKRSENQITVDEENVDSSNDHSVTSDEADKEGTWHNTGDNDLEDETPPVPKKGIASLLAGQVAARRSNADVVVVEEEDNTRTSDLSMGSH